MKKTRSARRMQKMLIMVAALTLVLGVAIGGTIAYLVATTEAVTNTFTVGNIQIDLDETTGESYKIIPGEAINKDPFATVKSGSEKCYLFVAVTNNLVIGGKTVGTPNIDPTKWQVVETSGNKTLYVSIVSKDGETEKEIIDAATADVKRPVFTTVTISGTDVTESNIADLSGKTMVINAYAHQSDNTNYTTAETAAKAWFANLQ